MNKKRRIVNKYLLIPAILTLLIFSFTIDISAESKEKSDTDRLIDDYFDTLPNGERVPDDIYDITGVLGPDAILAEIGSAIVGVRGRVISFFFLLLGTSVLIALASALGDTHGALVRPLVSSIAALAVFSRIMPLISELGESLGIISGFFSAFVPLFCSAMALGGQTVSAGTAGVGMSITLEVCSLFTEKFLLVLVYAMFFSSLAGSFGGGIAAVSRAVKNIFTRGLALLSTVFIGMLTLQTVISASADNMALRGARYAATSIIPIVGGTVSGALSTLVGGAAYAKGIIGGSAVGVILTMAIAPLITLLLYKFCFFLAISFLEFCSMTEGAACLGGIRDALDALISVYTLTIVLYMLEITVMLISGVNF